MRHALLRAVLLLALAAALPACGGGGGGGGGGSSSTPVLLVSSSSAPTSAPGNGDSSSPSMSADGRYVVFASLATNLVAPATTAARSHIYLKDLQTGATTLISRPTGTTPGTEGDGNSFNPVISSDGRYVAYTSSSRNLVTSVATITNAATGPFNNVYLHDTQGPATSLVSNSTASATQEANGHSGAPAIAVLAGPVTQVVFESSATDLVAGLTDTNTAADVFLKPQGQPIECVSLSTTAATTGNAGSSQPSISADGNLVAYQSLATNLYAVDVNNPADANGLSDVLVRNLTTDVNKRVSMTDAEAEVTGTGIGSVTPMISADGAHVVFISSGANLGDPFPPTHPTLPGLLNDVYIRVNWANADPQTEHLSLHAGQGSGEGCTSPVISTDGAQVVWHSPADNLVNGDTNVIRDVFRKNRTSTVLDRVSLSSAGTEVIGGSGTISRPAMSTGGAFIAFDSNANVTGLGTAVRHIFRRG